MANTATRLDNILLHHQDRAPLHNQDVKYAKHLQTFGEMCATVDTSNKVGRYILNTRGQLCMLLHYSTQHAGDVYQFFTYENKPNHIQLRLTENVPKTLSKAPCLVAKRMSPTLHLLLFAQSM